MLMAVIFNIILIGCEGYVFSHIRKKQEIVKYYTYLQNLIALLISFLFVSVFLFTGEIPEFVKGLRYVATCGLSATTLIFVLFLGAGKKVSMSEDDFLAGCSPRFANFLLHYFCPFLSLLSFLFFEKNAELTNGIWTTLAAIPSCAYWIMYAILSANHLWQEPYDFTSSDKKNKILDFLPFVFIPILFIAVSFVLWQMK